MSFWATVGVKIEDLDCFRRACERNGVSYNDNPRVPEWNGDRVVAELHDTESKPYGSTAYIVSSKGALRLVMDTDAHYSTLTRRLGPNGGRLGQDYAREVIRKESINQGGVISNETVDEKGWLVLRVAR